MVKFINLETDQQRIRNYIRSEISELAGSLFAGANIHIHLQVDDPAKLDSQLVIVSQAAELLYQKVETELLHRIANKFNLEELPPEV